MLSIPSSFLDRCLSDFAVFVFAGFAMVLSAILGTAVVGKLGDELGLVTASAVSGFHP